MLAQLLYHIYPQHSFAKAIIKVLDSDLIEDIENATLVDAPCGTGVISYWLKRHNKEADIIALDIERKKLALANRFIDGLDAKETDIFDLSLTGNNNVWLLINSLYCLPQPDRLMAKLQPSMKHIIAIFPDVEHQSYQDFFINHPGFSNPSAMTKSDTLAFFSKHNYKLLDQQELIFLPVHRFKIPFFNATLRVPRPCLWLMGLFEPWVKPQKGRYWLAVFKFTSP